MLGHLSLQFVSLDKFQAIANALEHTNKAPGRAFGITYAKDNGEVYAVTIYFVVSICGGWGERIIG